MDTNGVADTFADKSQTSLPTASPTTEGQRDHVGSNSSAHYGYHISTGVNTNNAADYSPHVNATNAFADTAADAVTDVAAFTATDPQHV